MEDEHDLSPKAPKKKKKRGRPKKSTPQKREVDRARQRRFRTQKTAHLHHLQREYAKACDRGESVEQLAARRKVIREVREKLHLWRTRVWETPEQRVQFMGYRTPSSAVRTPGPHTQEDDVSPPPQREVITNFITFITLHSLHFTSKCLVLIT